MANGVLIRGDVGLMHKSWYRLLRKELGRRKRVKRRAQEDDGKEDDSGLNLPMEIVEKILSLVPFPDVFKGRVLSRSWRRKFKMSERGQATESPFLQELSIAAAKWPVYCPVFMSTEGDLVGYNQLELSWEKIPLSAYIPLNRFHADRFTGKRIEFGGSLLCIHEKSLPFMDGFISLLVLLVANIQTGSWKSLICPLDLERSRNPQVLLINEADSNNYKLLVYDCKNIYAQVDLSGFQLETHMFDSSSRTWTSKASSYVTEGVTDGISSYIVHIDGNMYCMGPDDRHDYCEIEDLLLPDIVRVFKYNLVDSVWSVSPNSIFLTDKIFTMGGVFLCGSKLMLVTIHEEPEEETQIESDFEDLAAEREYIISLRLRFRACAYEVCMETLRIEEVSRSPLDIFRGVSTSLMSDGNYIYFCSSNYPNRSKVKVSIVRYNVSEQVWDRIPSPPTKISVYTPWARSAYVPGQKPFALA